MSIPAGLTFLAIFAAACGEPPHEVRFPELAAADLYGLWLDIDEADGTERAFVLAGRDDFLMAAAGHMDVSTTCIDGEITVVSTFEVAEDQLIETVLEDRGAPGTSIGRILGTKILDYTGDTLVLASRSEPSGPRTYRRVTYHDPRAPSGWALVSVDAAEGHIITTASLAFDDDDDWHLAASEQALVSSDPASGTFPPPQGLYASRKSVCAMRLRTGMAYGGGSIHFHDGHLVIPEDRGNGTIMLESREVDDNQSPLLPWDAEPVPGGARLVAESDVILPDGTMRFVRGDMHFGYELWTRPPGGPWETKQLPVQPDSRIVYDREGLAAFLTYGAWNADIVLWRETNGYAFSSEPVAGTASTEGPNGPADPAVAPDGSIHVLAMRRGLELFSPMPDGWRRTRLTHHEALARMVIDDAGVHHVAMIRDGLISYLRWDGVDIVRELPGLPVDIRGEASIELSQNGTLAIVLGGGAAAVRRADASTRRKMGVLSLRVEGEGQVDIAGVGSCTGSCRFQIPVGTFARFSTSPSSGYVFAGFRAPHGPVDPYERMGSGGQIPMVTEEVTVTAIFLPSHVERVVGLEPAGLEFIDVAPDGRSAALLSLQNQASIAGRDIYPGVFASVLDPEGRWTLVRALPAELPRPRPVLMADGGLALVGEFSGTIDLGTGPISPTTDLGPDLVVARFAPTGQVSYARTVGSRASSGGAIRRGDDLVVAVEGGGPGVIDGRVLPEGPGLVVFDPMGRVSATASLEVRPVALAAGPDGGIYVIGHQAPDSPDKVPTLLAFDAKLEFRWRRHLGREALTALAVDDQGRVHVYGESRGGDYGAGEMPDPKASWAKTGAVVVTLDSVGTLVLARGLPSHEAVVAMGVEGDAIVVITPGGMMSRIGESPDEDQSASLTTPSPTPTPPRYTVRGGAWLGDRFRLGVQQNGTVIWNAETTNRSAGVLVDGVLDP